jgi:peptide/nickel transport system substrate-binding protein
MKKHRLISVLTIMFLILVACTPAVPATPVAAPPATAVPATAVVEQPATAVPATAVPEQPVVEEPTAEKPAEGGVDMNYAGHIITITLKKGLKWSDGSAITSADVVGSYELFWATNQAIWQYLEKTQAVDEQTTAFYLNDLSPRIIRYVLRQMLVYPRSMYGTWMDKAAEIRKVDPKHTSDAFKTFLTDFSQYKPTLPVVDGPFYFNDPSQLSESQFELVKNPTGYNADKISFDTISAVYGESNVCTPLVQSGLIDFQASGYPPAAVQSFEEAGLTVLIKPLGIGPGLIFNNAKEPYNKKEFRQALAYIIDRQQNGTIAMGKAGHAFKYVSGLPDRVVEEWLPDIAPQLNTYEKNWAKAEELLKSIGFTKNAGGNWVDAKGQNTEHLIYVAGQWSDYLGAAEDAADQLNKFGIKTSVKAFQDVEYDNTLISGKFDMLVGFIGANYNPPFPYREYETAFLPPYNNPEDPNAPGASIPYEMTTPDGATFDIREAVQKMSAGMDPEPQKPWLAKAVLALNSNVYVLPLWERYSTNVINMTRVEGWADPASAPIWLNVHYADHPVVIQMLEGSLKPVSGAWSACSSYVQPPRAHFNAFISDYVISSMTPEVGQMLYLPFFYYIWADKEYKPILGESYKIVK